jgi:hypothetical protein
MYLRWRILAEVPEATVRTTGSQSETVYDGRNPAWVLDAHRGIDPVAS